MNCHISSEKLNNPMLKELLGFLTSYFNSIESKYYVIGAAARDIILSAIHGQRTKRGTADLDIAIAILDWDNFDAVERDLCKFREIKKVKNQRQRFVYKEIFFLDIVPFGGVAKDDKNIYWPPEEIIAMSVAGFQEATKDILEVTIDNEFSVKVVQLPGIFLLKLNAFKDRHIKNNKDADDMAYIISSYLDINEERAAKNHYDIYEKEPFNKFVVGATLLGRDVKHVLNESPQTLEIFIEILQLEINAEEESILINQMLETHATLKYEIAFEALESLLCELKCFSIQLIP
ncbi:nucleotidyltransferase [Odoribacter sp. OttesenSCG-928-L07]|nr:nucleotidyltransferase [Odoribacter sp. OttesenSCG-928-L07]